MRYRKKLFIDPKVQGALMIRAVGYWLFCLLTMSLALVLWRLWTGPARLFFLQFDELWQWYGPAAIASLLVLPLVVIDVVRLSNRFAGPLYRLRREMRKLAEGEPVRTLKFRDGDFWAEFADEFNAVAQRLDLLQVEPNPPAVANAPPQDESETIESLQATGA
ncbi:MAG: hypothetical protein IT427_20190 [Pirellulales bacterium]|nr:hypothetical protein [Pirellulales bacterium]